MGTKISETDALDDSSRALEAKTRLLQTELSEISFTIGQRDQELRAKEAELDAVKQGVHSFEDEIDEMNRLLSDQCNRVQQVEMSWHRSEDLQTKVRILHGMLKESHDT